MRIEHANITVNNVEASVDFYLRLMGGKVRWEGTNSLGNRAVHIGDGQTSYGCLDAIASCRLHDIGIRFRTVLYYVSR